MAVDAADRDERLAGAQVGGRERDAADRDAVEVAADLAGESAGEFGERSSGRTLRAENGRQARARRSACRINALIAAPASHPPAAGRDAGPAGRAHLSSHLQALREYRSDVNVVPYLIGIAVIVVGLAVSIALHEIGHLVPAKKFGVRVGQYMIGFGPTSGRARTARPSTASRRSRSAATSRWPACTRLRRRRRARDGRARDGRAGGGSSPRWCRTPGRRTTTRSKARDDRVFYKLPVYKRIIIMLGGPVMNLLFAIVLFTVLFSAIGIQQGDDHGRHGLRVRARRSA